MPDRASLRRRALLGATAAALALPSRAFAEADPVVLGAVYPFSGLLAPFGDESFRGLELAVEACNAAGGLWDRPIRLLKGDAVDPVAAAAESKRLIGAEHAAGLFGSFASPIALAASQVAELAGIPFFELGAICDGVVDRGFRLLFRACSSATTLAALSVDTVAGPLAHAWRAGPGSEIKVAILHEDGLYGSTVASLQAARCAERLLPVAAELAYGAAAPDMGNVVARLRGADVSVLLHTGYSNDAVALFRQMAQTGWAPRIVVGCGGGYALADTAATVGPAFDGVLNVGFPPYAVAPSSAPGLDDVGAAYERKYGAKPRSGHSLANYVGARLFLDALRRAGSAERDAVRAATLATNVPLGGTANGWGARFDERGQNTLALPVVAQWRAGVLRTVFPPEAAVAPLQPAMGR